MAKEPQSNGPVPNPDDLDQEWSWVESDRSANELVRRSPPGAKVETTGLTDYNAEGSDLWDEIVMEHGMQTDTAAARMGVKEATRSVAVVPVAGGAEGATPVVRNDEKHAHSMHMAHVFAKFPSLRPAGTVRVLVYKQYNKKGKPYLQIAFQTAQAVSTTTREGSQEHQRRAEAKARREARRNGGAK